MTLHAFSDASQDAFGSVIYLKSDNEEPQLLISRARVTPVKKTLTIPKLELTAACMSTRLVKFVKESFKNELKFNDVYYWVDSKVAQSWIQNGKDLPAFEKARVKEILKKSNRDQWHYVNTKENPADVLSRGASLSKLKSSNLWFKSPEWLKIEENWPIETKHSWTNDVLEAVSLPITTEQKTESEKPLIQIDRFSSLRKLVRTAALILKWPKIVKSNQEEKSLKAADLEESKQKIFRMIQHEHFEKELNYLQGKGNCEKTNLISQLNLFLDNNKLIRCKGRLENGNISWEANNPILLPYKSHLTDLIVLDK